MEQQKKINRYQMKAMQEKQKERKIIKELVKQGRLNPLFIKEKKQ